MCVIFDSITLGRLSEINWSKFLTCQIRKNYGGDEGQRLFPTLLRHDVYIYNMFVLLIHNEYISLWHNSPYEALHLPTEYTKFFDPEGKIANWYNLCSVGHFSSWMFSWFFSNVWKLDELSELIMKKWTHLSNYKLDFKIEHYQNPTNLLMSLLSH